MVISGTGVLEPDGEAGVWRAWLATNVLEAAGDLDLIVQAAGVPYRLVIQAELYATVEHEAIATLLGRISQRELHAIRWSLASDGESLDGMDVGLPLGGIDDWRRKFKEHELAELQALVGPRRAGERWDGSSAGRTRMPARAGRAP